MHLDLIGTLTPAVGTVKNFSAILRRQIYAVLILQAACWYHEAGVGNVRPIGGKLDTRLSWLRFVQIAYRLLEVGGIAGKRPVDPGSSPGGRAPFTSGRFGRQDHSGLFGQHAQIKEIKMLFD